MPEPLYTFQPSLKRALIPKILSLLVLGAIFYLGVLLNLSLLQLNFSEDLIKLGTAILLTMVIIVGILLSFRHARQPYLFYPDRLVHGTENIYYRTITSCTVQKDIWDHLFHTYSLGLGNHLFLRHIPLELNLQEYLQQLVRYSAGQNK